MTDQHVFWSEPPAIGDLVEQSSRIEWPEVSA